MAFQVNACATANPVIDLHTAIRATMLTSMRPFLRRLAVRVAASFLPVAVLLDLLAFPTQPLSVLYAIPMLAAAVWLSPRGTAGLVVLALLVSLIAPVLQATEVADALLRLVLLSIIGGMSYLLAARMAEVQERESARRELQRQLAMVAHDLRTPLAAVLGYAELLRDADVQEQQRMELAHRIETRAWHMAQTVGDLADVARLDLGMMEMRPRPVDLVALASHVVETTHTTGGSRRIELDSPAELTGVWDPDRVERVLTNLVDNAVHYSPEGSEIQMRVWTDGSSAFVSVTDQGGGMQPEDLQRIFRPFSRISLPPDAAGTGLGLYICQEIVRAHGGRIWASSLGRGRGSTLAFSLPLTRKG